MSAIIPFDAEYAKYLPTFFFDESSEIDSCSDEITFNSRKPSKESQSLNSPITSQISSPLSLVTTDSLDKTESIFTNKHLLLSSLTCTKKTVQLQKILSSDIIESKDITTILTNWKGHFFNWMIGRSSNYFMSDLIKKCSKNQKLAILSEVYSWIDIIAMNEYGTHPIQALIEKVSSKEEILMLINSISTEKKLINLSKDINGTYIVQKIISFFNENYRRKLNKIILDHILDLSVDKYGVCIVKKLIMNCNDINSLSYIWNTFIKNFLFIAENEYGNYALQAFIEKTQSNTSFCNVINQAILMNFVRLCNNKSGSHIVEMMIERLNSKQQQEWYNQLFVTKFLKVLSQSKYGKFIIQKLLSNFC